ncbi:MAG TPA: tetratricopeptide repeat protein, partial [Gemmatimonadales bacterium]|nr:tetratricopeptide repeat protein [Gemmatimonadales bacterium]
FEEGADPVPDLSVYNRIGDLYLKANEPGAAVQAYERAADLYGEQGFYNNAIALCGKILRVNPGRIQTYLKLAHLHARKNVVIEAKKNLLEYLERMNALNQLDDAFNSVKEFADQFPGNKEIRLMLSELLRASSRNAEAREQLEKLASDLEARGDTIGARKTLQRLQAMDAGELPPADSGRAPGGGKTGDLIFLDTGGDISRPSPRSGPNSRKTRVVTPRSTTASKIAGLPLIDVGEPGKTEHPPQTPAEPSLEIETSSLVDTPIELESVQPVSDEAQLEGHQSAEVAKTLGFEPTEVESGADVPVQPLEGLELDAPLPDAVDLEASGADLGLERSGLDETEPLEPSVRDDFLMPEPLDVPPLDIERSQVSGLGLEGEELELTEFDAGSDEAGFAEPEALTQPSIADLEDRVLDDPDDPEAHRALGEALLAAGEQLRGQEELELALAGHETREDWDHAGDLINELIRLDPNGVRYHQKRVEIAFRSGDRSRLIDAYVELADALLRVGAIDKALAVYRRVSEHDPGNPRAAAALDALAPVEDTLPPIPPVAPVPPAP